MEEGSCQIALGWSPADDGKRFYIAMVVVGWTRKESRLGDAEGSREGFHQGGARRMTGRIDVVVACVSVLGREKVWRRGGKVSWLFFWVH